MAWRAKHNYARISERKVRLVAGLIRGRECNEAVELLRFTHNRAAQMLDRVLKSAMASANEAEADMNKLYIAEARVDPGPIIKRWRPKDRGRAHPIQKRTSHIVVTVCEDGPGPSGEQVRLAREESGLNVSTFARRFGCPVNLWKRIEDGEEPAGVPRSIRPAIELFIVVQERRRRKRGRN